MNDCNQCFEPITVLYFNTEKLIVYTDKEETIRTGTLKLVDNGKGCLSYTYHPDEIKPLIIPHVPEEQRHNPDRD